MRHLILIAGIVIASMGASTSAHAANTQAALLFDTASASPGSPVTASIQLKMNEGWHTYWRFGGDAGKATKIKWALPEGITAGEIQWPRPVIDVLEGIITFGYHDEVLLPVPFQISPTVATGDHTISARVSWLECSDETCIPASQEVSAVLTVGPQRVDSEQAILIAEALGKVPGLYKGPAPSAAWDGPAHEDTRILIVRIPSKPATGKHDFIPFESTGHDVSAGSELMPVTENETWLRKKVFKWDGDWPTEVRGLIANVGEGNKILAAGEATIAIGTAEALNAGASGSTQSNAADPAQKGLFAVLWSAFFGGLILNIMPCVLPVISLKILSFVKQAGESKAKVRALGLGYTAGVLASFLALGGLALGLKHTGHLFGWGIQFGNPYFVVAITILITVVALNLFGIFEITLSGKAMQSADEASSKTGLSGAFFGGLLATALATSCTAPLLGGAVGFAVQQTDMVAILIFLTVGVGMALPYLILCFQPSWISFLPKPGAWMEKFKIAMGFPMLATAVFLLSLLVPHYGSSGVLWVGIFLVMLALAAWMWGTTVQRGRSNTRSRWRIATIALLIASFWITMESQLDWRAPRQASNGGSLQEHADGIPWQAWDLASIDAARREGRPVLVDFTAEWCLTCRVNKKTSIEIDSTKAKLKEINAVAMLADYTHTPEAMTKEILKFGVSGVPLVLVYPADPTAPPIILPALLTPSIVHDALDRAAKI